MMQNKPTPVCSCCDRIARDIPTVQIYAADVGVDPETYVQHYDASYNKATGEFLCDYCFNLQIAESA